MVEQIKLLQQAPQKSYGLSPTWVPTNAPGKAVDDGLRAGVPLIHVEDRDEVACSQYLAVRDIWGVDQWIESPPTRPFLCHSDFGKIKSFFFFLL